MEALGPKSHSYCVKLGPVIVPSNQKLLSVIQIESLCVNEIVNNSLTVICSSVVSTQTPFELPINVTLYVPPAGKVNVGKTELLVSEVLFVTPKSH